MKFIKKIREKILKKSPYEMHKLMELPHTSAWTQFESRSESLNAKKLVKLWRLSELSGDEFMEMIAKEVESKSQ
ncbi:hypothetical protein IQ278_12125 [Tolypothrix sp. LEGE 11397]|uniref:hypothetical protein n=1 Tax=Tolypothrix sp. LEGE 11397 TaxID=2777971 RepID=UPI0018829FF3|nr:hypothetical protein [Tolypothrix sp. LEGE 11397]MBE9082861.1 hypothetical protein [Tolypothrix sp. LEGE 11397]